MDIIKEAINYLKMKYENSNYLKENSIEKNYRIEHSFRVAGICKEIASKENINVDASIIAGLFHDISYCETFSEANPWEEHGRVSAKMAREFLQKTNLADDLINDVCYGIATHVDNKADFDHKPSLLSMIVSEADMIDRLDVYRLYENLEYNSFSALSLEEKISFVDKRLKTLEEYSRLKFCTKTSNELLQKALDFQKIYFGKLRVQLQKSFTI